MQQMSAADDEIKREGVHDSKRIPDADLQTE